MAWTRAQTCALCSQIAYLRVIGYTAREIPEKIQTPDHPSGVSYRLIFNHVKEHEQEYKPIEQWYNLYRREKAITVKQLAADTIKKELETYLGDAAATLLQAVRDGDAEAAKWIIEQSIGKPTQTTKLTGGVLHGHVVFDPRPVKELAMQENDMINSQKLLKLLPAVTEPEPLSEPLMVPTTAESEAIETIEAEVLS